MRFPQLPEGVRAKVLLTCQSDGRSERPRPWVKTGFVDRDQHHDQLRVLREDHACGGDPAHSRHHDVHDDEPRRQPLDRVYRLLARARLPY